MATPPNPRAVPSTFDPAPDPHGGAGRGHGPSGGPRRPFSLGVRATLLTLLLAVLIPVLLSEVALHYSMLQAQRAAEYDSNLEIARSVATTFDAFTQHVLGREYAIGLAFTGPEHPPPDQANAFLAANVRQQSAVKRYTWVDPSGRAIASSNPATVGLDFSADEYFQQISHGQAWAVNDLVIAKTDGRPTFFVARGVRDSNGALLGIIVAGVDPERLGGVFDVQRSKGGAILIADRQGSLVYRYPEAPLTWEQRSALAGQSMIRRALAGEESTDTVVSPIDGTRQMSAAVPIRTFGWVAGASRSEAEVMGPLHRDLALGLGVPALVSVLALLGALYVSRGLTDPICRLRDAALALARGHPASQVEVRGPSEVAQVVQAFNWMVREMRAREEQLGVTATVARRQAEEAERRAAELDAIVSAVADGLLIYGPSGELVRMNSAAERMLGYGAAEAGRPLLVWAQKLRPETPDGAPFPVDELPPVRALRGETVSGVVLRLHPIEDGTLWVSASAAPIRAPDGRLLGAVATLTDVTKDREHRERQEDFIRSVSHDLRAPLAIILGQAQIVQRARANSSLVGKGAEAIVASSRRMNSMIQDLVDSARLESGQLKLSLEPLDLRKFVLDLKERLAVSYDVGRLRLEAPESLPMVRADSERLERILVNLLSNAYKYSAPTTPILVSLVPHDREVVISVTDQGRGIPAEDLPHLFERFYRSKETREHREGLGLGLYITKGLIEALGGRIWVESRVAEGSTFSFTLPIVR